MNRRTWLQLAAFALSTFLAAGACAQVAGKDYNFSFVGKAPADAEWARYRKLARK